MRAEVVDSHRRTSEQLFQAQKMEAVGQLTGGVAHDFNNILTDRARQRRRHRRGRGGDRPHIAAARAADRRCRPKGLRADAPAAGLLAPADLSSRKAVRPQRPRGIDRPADAAHARRTRRRSRPSARRSLWTATVDRTQVETSLINLCINARDAMPEGGRITIETKNVTLDRDYVLRQEDDMAAGDYVMLSVTDTGGGMPPGSPSAPSSRSSPPSRSGKGTGLGLSMVYGFIRQSSGHIKIYSEVGHGTTVKMYFPRNVAPSEAPVGARRRARRRRGGNERILVVEDEAGGARHRRRAAAQSGLRCAAGRPTPIRRLTLLRDHRFDLMLTDVVMPGRLNGKGLADEVERSWPGTRVVFMSGYSENALLNDGRLDSWRDAARQAASEGRSCADYTQRSLRRGKAGSSEMWSGKGEGGASGSGVSDGWFERR